MSVELYALFSYAFTAAIALVMIGAVVLLNSSASPPWIFLLF